jgi:hypothetical protein
MLPGEAQCGINTVIAEDAGDLQFVFKPYDNCLCFLHSSTAAGDVKISVSVKSFDVKRFTYVPKVNVSGTEDSGRRFPGKGNFYVFC